MFAFWRYHQPMLTGGMSWAALVHLLTSASRLLVAIPDAERMAIMVVLFPRFKFVIGFVL
jgi:hypothetical protein